MHKRTCVFNAELESTHVCHLRYATHLYTQQRAQADSYGLGRARRSWSWSQATAPPT
jgi:hypothetical protein